MGLEGCWARGKPGLSWAQCGAQGWFRTPLQPRSWKQTFISHHLLQGLPEMQGLKFPAVGAGGPAGGRDQEETQLQCPSPAPQRQTQLPLIRGGPHSPDRTLTPLGTPLPQRGPSAPLRTPLPQTGPSAPPGTPLPGWNPLPYQAPLAPFQVGAELPHTQTAGEDLMTVSPQ